MAIIKISTNNKLLERMWRKGSPLALCNAQNSPSQASTVHRDFPDVQAGFRKGRGADSLEKTLMLGKTEGRSRA